MMILQKLLATFPTEDDCKQFLMQRRWPHGVECPRCNNKKVWALKTRPWHWVCKQCSEKPYRFSILVGTIFENTNYPLKTWFEVLWQMLNSKKGVSALQIHRQIGSGSYRTAWYLCHRLRAGMQDTEFRKLMGIVEVDETFIGGKDKNRHWNKKTHMTGGSDKMAVIGAISRKGNVMCKMIENTSQITLDRFVRHAVSDKVSLVGTDEALGYRHLAPSFPHEVVKHSEHEYVRGNIHTNNLESFWSLLKRGIVGTYHNVNKRYLPLYLNEFAFRYNHRNDPDIFGSAIAHC